MRVGERTIIVIVTFWVNVLDVQKQKIAEGQEAPRSCPLAGRIVKIYPLHAQLLKDEHYQREWV